MQLNKLQPAAQNKAETILRITKKNFEDEELIHELFLTTKQATENRNAFAIKLTKLSKAQISKIIQMYLLVLG